MGHIFWGNAKFGKISFPTTILSMSGKLKDGKISLVPYISGKSRRENLVGEITFGKISIGKNS